MNKYLYLSGLFLICTLFATAQKKGYLGIEMGLGFIKNSDPVISGHVGGNGSLSPNFMLGGQIGVMKLQEFPGVSIPIQLRLTGLLAKNPKKVSPLIFIEPGINAYHHEETNSPYVYSGGFVFYGGAGAKFPSKKDNSGAFLTIGYSSIGIDVNKTSTNYTGIALRFGVML